MGHFHCTSRAWARAILKQGIHRQLHRPLASGRDFPEGTVWEVRWGGAVFSLFPAGSAALVRLTRAPGKILSPVGLGFSKWKGGGQNPVLSSSATKAAGGGLSLPTRAEEKGHCQRLWPPSSSPGPACLPCCLPAPPAPRPLRG